MWENQGARCAAYWSVVQLSERRYLRDRQFTPGGAWVWGLCHVILFGSEIGRN